MVHFSQKNYVNKVDGNMQMQNCLKISFNIMKQKFKVVSIFSNLHVVLAQTNPNILSTHFLNIIKIK
jgi:hypothetical protein